MPRPKSGLTRPQLGHKYRQEGAARRRAVVDALGHYCNRCMWGLHQRNGHMALTVLVNNEAVPSDQWRNVETGTRLLYEARDGGRGMTLLCINCQTVDRWSKEAA